MRKFVVDSGLLAACAAPLFGSCVVQEEHQDASAQRDQIANM